MSQVSSGGPSAPTPVVETESNLVKIIAASSAGTLIEWYDFYIFASLSAIVAGQFFPEEEGIIGFIKTLAVIWIGFVVRPFGALVFGRLGDIIGRKYAFLVTLLLMGGATFAIGLLPTYSQVGMLAPILLLGLRVVQGLALGGEYGGAATYVAEHCPDGKRGFWTSWIQTTATLGLFVSLGVILFCRTVLFTPADFKAWGWRVPFWISLILVAFSFMLRMRLKESPLFQRMKSTGKSSKSPLTESFGNWTNLKLVLIALFGATAGQGVVWYTGQFYALAFLQKTMLIEFKQSNYIIAAALLLATPFFIFWGWLSDRVGRKWIMMAGCLIAASTYLPIYHAMYETADLTRKTLVTKDPISVVKQGMPAKVEKKDASTGAEVGDTLTSTDISKLYSDGTKASYRSITIQHADKTKGTDGVTKKEILSDVTVSDSDAYKLMFLIFLQVFYVTMVYGPIAAFLVELFPTKIRYTSMSLPYHIGNGVFGGLVPFAATWIATATAGQTNALTNLFGGSKFLGLVYPISVAAITLVIGTIVIRENRSVKMHDGT